jgi:DNA transformation protein and related proteins
MPVSPGYRAFVLEQLQAIGTVSARPMFGGVGLYRDGLFFGLLDDDTTYLKVDDQNRPEYEALGMPPFQPPGPEASRNYYQLPEEVLEDREALRTWVDKALAAARRKSVGKRKRPRP